MSSVVIENTGTDPCKPTSVATAQIPAGGTIEQRGSRYGNIQKVRGPLTNYMGHARRVKSRMTLTSAAELAFCNYRRRAVMLHSDDLERVLSASAFSADERMCSTRRSLLLAPLFGALSLAVSNRAAYASKINTSQTVVTLFGTALPANLWIHRHSFADWASLRRWRTRRSARRACYLQCYFAPPASGFRLCRSRISSILEGRLFELGQSTR